MISKKIRIITAVNLILSLLVICLILLIARALVSIPATTFKRPTPMNHIGRNKDMASKNLMDYALILKKNPFGFYAGELSPLGSKSDGARTSIDITLVGTISGSKKFAYAIFADKNNAQEIFKVGDSVFGLGKLQSVGKEMVVINDNGKLREIQLADIVTIKEATASAVKTSLPPGSFAGDKFARKVANTSYVVDSQKVQQALATPNQIMTDARLAPNIIDGRQEGFVLKEVREGGIYHSLGLQNGDVLLRINEYNISNPEAALQAFTALKGMDWIQLDIIRGGAKMTMTYQIK